MLGGRGWLSGTIGLIITIAMLAIAALLIFTPGNNTAATQTPISITQDTAATSGIVNVKAGAGTLNISGGSDQLVSGQLNSNVTNLTTNTSTLDKAQTVSVTENSLNGFIFGHNTNTLDLKLNNTLPLNLNLDTGAMSMNLDLKDVMANTVTVKTGASSMHLALGDKATTSTVNINAGASSLDISLPLAVGARITVDAGLSSKNFKGFNKIDENHYESSGYGAAEKKIDLTFDTGASSMNVSWR